LKRFASPPSPWFRVGAICACPDDRKANRTVYLTKPFRRSLKELTVPDFPTDSVTPQPVQSGLSTNAAGTLAYVTIIPAIIFLAVDPYNKNSFVRFHSWQCLFFAGALFVLHLGLSIFTIVPVLALVTFPLHLLVSLGGFILWIIVLMKANQGQMYKLPVIGDLAEKQANAM